MAQSLCETPLFFEFSLCLSRACLGKMMHFMYKFCDAVILYQKMHHHFTKTGSG